MEPGTKVGRYVTGELVGHGGMADVFLVVDEVGECWALKVLTLRRPEIRDRFLAEARIQLSLDHPNLVRAREVVEVEGWPALVLEFVPGSSLDQWSEHRQVSLETRDRLAFQILAGVAHAHARGLVHRDLKPANVMVLDTPDGPVAKVTDFGLAKEEGGLASTRSGIALGTPRYMAPEQIRDAKRVDARADLWSLGALLYELYTDRAAFHRDSMMEIFNAVMDGVYPDPAQHGAPERVCAAIRACLRPDPADRVHSCEALATILRGEGSFPVPSPPRPPPPPQPLPPPPPPPPAPAPTLVMTAPSVLLARAPPATPRSPLRARSWALPWIAAWLLALVVVLSLFAVGVGALAVWTMNEAAREAPDPAPREVPVREPRRRTRR